MTVFGMGIIALIWGAVTSIYVYAKRNKFLALSDGMPNANVSLTSSEKRKVTQQVNSWLKGFGISLFVHLLIVIIAIVTIVVVHATASVMIVIGVIALWLIAMLISSIALGLVLMR